MQWIHRYLLLCKLSATAVFDGGLLHVLAGYVLKLIHLVIFVLVWKTLLRPGADESGMTLSMVLTYTLLSSLLSEQLNVTTPATTAFWEGSIASRYLRPMPVLLQLTGETMGRWLPALLLYSLPVFLLAPLLGIALLPTSMAHGLWFIPSLLLAISLGFALDFLFASVVIYIQNANWTVFVIRQAMVAIFSGALIPFALLPWGVGHVLSLLPFGSVAGAPLSIYTGQGDVMPTLGLQLLWNGIVWWISLAMFRRSEERMVSYGG